MTHTQFIRYRRIISAALLDFLIVIGAYLAVFAVIPERIFHDPSQNTAFVMAVAAAMVAALFGVKAYHRIWSRTSGHSVSILLDAVVIVTVTTITIFIFVNPRPLTIGTIFAGNLLSLIGIVGVRYRSRLISGFAWRWYTWWGDRTAPPRMRTLIVGAGESGQALAWRLQHRTSDRQHDVIGFIDDDPQKRGMFVEGIPVLGNRTDIPQIVESHKIEMIAVAVHNVSNIGFREILRYCEGTNALIKIVPDVLSELRATEKTALLRDVQPEDLLGRGVVSRHEAVDLSPVLDKVILVTGAAGSIGSELSRQIMTYQPKRVLLLDNNESGLYDLALDIETAYPEADVVVILADITLANTLRGVFETHRPQIVFHAAAYKHVPMLEFYPAEAVRVNIMGTKIAADLSSKYGVERFVLISTDKAVDPSSVMGATKRVCELMLHAYCVDNTCPTLFASVRFGNVLGSRGSVVPTFTRQIEQGGPITVTHPEMTRYFMSISEAANLIIHAAAMTHGDDIFVLQMGEVVSIVELAERLIRLRGLRPHHDIEIKFTGVRPGEKMHETLFGEKELPAPTDHPHIVTVSNWPDDFSSEQYWRDIDMLHSGELARLNGDALGLLRRIIGVGEAGTNHSTPAESDRAASGL